MNPRSMLPETAQIFISYAREDRDAAGVIAAALGRQGWSVWWDPKIRLGTSYQATIEAALDAAQCVVVLWSSHSRTSHWVKEEAQSGVDREILVPVQLEDVQAPLGFRSLQAARLTDWDGNEDYPEFQALLENIAALIGPGTPPNPPPAPAPTVAATGPAARSGPVLPESDHPLSGGDSGVAEEAGDLVAAPGTGDHGVAGEADDSSAANEFVVAWDYNLIVAGKADDPGISEEDHDPGIPAPVVLPDRRLRTAKIVAGTTAVITLLAYVLPGSEPPNPSPESVMMEGAIDTSAVSPIDSTMLPFIADTAQGTATARPKS